MKKNDIIILIAGCIALIGCFMPIAEKGSLFVNVSHMTQGLPIFLYFLPIVVIVISIISLYQKIKNPKPWYISVGSIELIISILATIGGIYYLKTFDQFGRIFLKLLSKKNVTEVSPKIGLGSFLLSSSYLTIIILGLLYKPRNKLES